MEGGKKEKAAKSGGLLFPLHAITCSSCAITLLSAASRFLCNGEEREIEREGRIGREE